jgi:hypothetical protein
MSQWLVSNVPALLLLVLLIVVIVGGALLIQKFVRRRFPALAGVGPSAEESAAQRS